MSKNCVHEICNLVGCISVEVYFGYCSANGCSCKVTTIEFLSKSCDLITKEYKGIQDCDEALEMFVKENFVCDKFFMTNRNFKYKSEVSRYGSMRKQILEGNLHTVEIINPNK